MSDDVTDGELLDLSGLGMDDSLEESVLARVLNRVLASSDDGPINSFTASI